MSDLKDLNIDIKGDSRGHMISIGRTVWGKPSFGFWLSADEAEELGEKLIQLSQETRLLNALKGKT